MLEQACALAALLDPPSEVVARLEDALLRDPDAGLRRLAAVALGELEANNPQTLSPQTLQALGGAAETAADVDLRRAARRALERIERAES